MKRESDASVEQNATNKTAVKKREAQRTDWTHCDCGFICFQWMIHKKGILENPQKQTEEEAG